MKRTDPIAGARLNFIYNAGIIDALNDAET